MKIQNDQLTALQQAAANKSAEKKDGSDAFAALLAKEVGEGQSSQSGFAAPPLAGYAALDVSGSQGADAAAASGQLSEEEQAVMRNMDSLLAKWEDYADQLASGSGGDSLKQAYGVLENIETGVKQLKDDLPSDANTGLGSLVNELEVMTVTEKIKFNRGDYI
ncbi:conserved hypothetical protein [Solidesulfovibrio fructosivorans JJ]]|uniref:Uncharacterized protein n=1 Tax=Solidesulfovibrio fructosivorans JJ] TaxID=596151 RepID=E1JVR0_SOLFR|nr:hypothetical protein [Solidesulfovibrio fructosivorans]EFL51548.1 conserved hypothetical protein [Solidesulfovibrio fructosivorans JJ]]